MFKRIVLADLATLVMLGVAFLICPTGLAQQLEHGNGVAAPVDEQPKIQQFLEAMSSGTFSPLVLQIQRLRLGPLAPALAAAYPIQVVIEADSEASVPQIVSNVERWGGQVEAVHGTSVQALLAPADLTTLADLAAVSFIRLPVRRNPFSQAGSTTSTYGTVTSEGVASIQAEAWQSAGIRGNGVSVGILDSFLDLDVRMGKELPEAERITTKSFARSGRMFNPSGERLLEVHGTGVAEIIHDIAPDADFNMAYFETDVELRQAIDWLIDERVDVINTSLGLYSGCMGNPQESILEPQIARAQANGVTWVTSVGNAGEAQHLNGRFTDRDEDGVHEFSRGDETLSLEVSFFEDFFFGERVASAYVAVSYGWDADCDSAANAYEIRFSLDEDAPEVLLDGFLQGSDWLWRPGYPVKIAFGGILSEDLSLLGSTHIIHIELVKLRNSVPDADFELMVENCTCDFGAHEYLGEAGTISLVEPALSPHALTVGGVHHDPSACDDSLCNVESLVFYSSKGPTPDDRIKPDLVAPTHVSTVTYGPHTGDGRRDNPGFTGTSSSAPHVAGAVALVLSAMPNLTPSEAQAFLEQRSVDLGAAGKDNLFGAGVLWLGQPPGSADRRAPSAPTSLSVSPEGWTNQREFQVDWVSPAGEDIAAAWYKLGLEPTAPGDGTRVTVKPMTLIAPSDGQHTLYVWLEDAGGKSDPLNRLSTTLRFDATAPSGTLEIASGSLTTTSRRVEARITASDGAGSGLAGMRFSFDGEAWTEFLEFDAKTTILLPAAYGRYRVFLQLTDVAGNVSTALEDEISLVLADTVAFSANLNQQVSLKLPDTVIAELPQQGVRFAEGDGTLRLDEIGLALDASTGTIEGQPSEVGEFTFEIDAFFADEVVAMIQVALQVSVAQVVLVSAEVLTDTVAAKRLSSAYVIDVPDYTAELLVKARSLSGGNLDLYVSSSGPLASLDAPDALVASSSPANGESIGLHRPEPGTYYIAVFNNASSEQAFALVATLIPAYQASIEPIDLGLDLATRVPAAPVAGTSLGTIQFVVEADAGAVKLEILLTNLSPGSLRLHLRYEAPIDWIGGQAVADWSSSSRTAMDSIVLLGADVQPGRYYVAVENLDPFDQNYVLNVSLE